MGRSWSIPYGATGKDAFVPTVDAEFTGPNGDSFKHRVKIDSGADRSIMPSSWAEIFGIELNSCRVGRVITAAGPVEDGRVHESLEAVSVRVEDLERGDFHTFDFHPLFMDGLHRPLFGRDDFFEHFIVTVDHRMQQITLEVREE